MPHAVVKLDPASSIAIYRQVADQIRAYIECGTLAPGASLPSVRSLATQLGVNFNTIAVAYRELAREGSITLRHGKSASVRSPAMIPPAKAAEAEGLQQRLRRLVAEMRIKGISAAAITHEVESILGR